MFSNSIIDPDWIYSYHESSYETMSDTPIKNVVKEVITDFWGTLSRLTFDYTFANNTQKRLTHEVYGRADGVALLLYNRSTRKIILTKQFRAPVWVAGQNNGFLIEVCGGAMDPNESPEETAIREAFEEVGCKPDSIQKVAATFLSPGLLHEKIHLFIGEYNSNGISKKNGGVYDEGEEIEILELSFDDAKELLKSDEVLDARTIILIQYLMLNNFID